MMVTAMSQPDSQSKQRQEPSGRRGVLVFLTKLVALMAVAYGLTIVPWFQHTAFPAYLRFNAVIAEFVLNAIGEDVHRKDFSISSAQFALQVQRGCDAAEPTMLFIAAVLAFPAGWRQRSLGIVVGIIALLGLNIVRIVSLFLIGAHAPRLFDSAHVEIWQTAFIMLTTLLWTTWAWWISRGPSRSAHAPA